MKLLAVDYDRTLKTSLKNLNLNKTAIEKFMADGNKFAIVTGRSYNSIKQEIIQNNIKYDYLACNNGLVIFDNKENIVKSFELSESDYYFIYNFFVIYNKENNIKLYNAYSTTHKQSNVLEFLIRCKNISSAKGYKEYLENSLPNIRCYREFNNLFIGNNITKKDAVSFIQKLENINKNNIFTVGDSLNDVEMLQEYNGYKMLLSKPSLWFKSIPTTKEVHTLIKKITK